MSCSPPETLHLLVHPGESTWLIPAAGLGEVSLKRADFGNAAQNLLKTHANQENHHIWFPYQTFPVHCSDRQQQEATGNNRQRQGMKLQLQKQHMIWGYSELSRTFSFIHAPYGSFSLSRQHLSTLTGPTGR